MDENNSKEINLLQLISIGFEWIKNVFVKSTYFFGFLLQLIFKRKLSMLFVIVICVAIGQFLTSKSNRVYKAEAVAMVYGSDAQMVREVSKQLENSLQSNSLISLSTKLHLPDSVAKNIVSIQTFYMIDYMRDSVADKIDFSNSHSLEDTINVRMKDRIYLQLKTKNIAQVPQVQSAILNYFNSNEVLMNRLQVKRNELQQQITICDGELNRIDSLASISYFKENAQQLKFDQNKLLLGEQNKQLFYNDLLRLQEIKSKSIIRLNDYKQPIEMPSGLIVNPLPLNGRLKYGVYSILIGALIGFVLIVFLEYLKPILTYLKNE